MNLYHLTPYEHTEQIMKDGLRADGEGNIFAFTDMLVANTIAKGQVFTKRYSVFKIMRKGVKGDLLKDNVVEFSTGYQRIIKQAWIEPKFLKFVCTQDVIWRKATTWDYLLGGRLGKTPQMVDEEFSIMTWMADETEKGKLSTTQITREANRRFKKMLKKKG